MIDKATIWQLEEKTEDCFTAVLLDEFNGFDVFVEPGMSASEYKEPGVYPVAMLAENLDENAGFTGHRSLAVTLTLRTHAGLDEDGSYRSSRSQHGRLKSRVMSVILQDDILEKLNAKSDGTIAIDQANVENLTRRMNTENSYHETAIIVDCVVRPVNDE